MKLWSRMYGDRKGLLRKMDRKIKGLALMLLSILFIVGFDSIDQSWATYVFDLSLHWSTVFMGIGLIGFLMIFFEKK